MDMDEYVNVMVRLVGGVYVCADYVGIKGRVADFRFFSWEIVISRPFLSFFNQNSKNPNFMERFLYISGI